MSVIYLFHCCNPEYLFYLHLQKSRMMAGDGVPHKFGVGLTELRVLMESRGHEGYTKLQTDYGGVLELCKKLYTSPNEGQC